MAEIKFSFICKKKFSELEGDDQIERFCIDCYREVINLDVLNEEEQHELSLITQRSELQMCVAVTVMERVSAPTCYPNFHTAALVGQVITFWNREEPLTGDEASKRIDSIFTNVRSRLS